MEKIDKKINILYFINGLGSGGTERHLAELLLSVNKDKISPYLIYYRNDNFYLNDVNNSEAKVFYISKRRRDKFLFWKLIFFINKAIRIIKDNNIDLIHSYGVGSNYWARIIGKLAGRKVIISIRSTRLEDRVSIFEKFLSKFDLSSWYILEKFLCRLACRVIVNSSAIKDIYSRRTNYDKNNIIVINNGFNFKKIKELDFIDKNILKDKYLIDKKKINIINVGRIREQKNQLCLLRAAKILAENNITNFKIIFAGKIYDYFKVLDDYIKENNLSDFVEFIGEQKDVYPIIKAADLFVLSSLWEGFPNVVMESMAIGTPVLSSNIEGIDALIKNSNTGLLFKLNDENDLAEKIKLFLSFSEEKKDMLAKNARTYVEENFSISKKADEYLKVYLDCLK